MGAPRCTIKLENTHGTELRELLYPWHPWFGLRVGVHAAIERSGDTVFRCSLSGSDADRWLEVPAWMFDRSACAKVRVADVHVDLAALTHLAALLRRALNDRFTSSNAPLSGVRLPLPVTNPFLFRMPAMTSSLAISTSCRTAAITSAEVLLRCPRLRLGKRISL